MMKSLRLLAIAYLMQYSVAYADEVVGRVVEYDTNRGIENVVVRLVKLDNSELDNDETDSNGVFELAYSDDISQFKLRYEPADNDSDTYYVAGRVRVERSSSEMVVDTMGLVKKSSTDVASAAKQQRDAGGYVGAGGDVGNVIREMQVARAIFGHNYDTALAGQVHSQGEVRPFGNYGGESHPWSELHNRPPDGVGNGLPEANIEALLEGLQGYTSPGEGM